MKTILLVAMMLVMAVSFAFAQDAVETDTAMPKVFVWEFEIYSEYDYRIFINMYNEGTKVYEVRAEGAFPASERYPVLKTSGAGKRYLIVAAPKDGRLLLSVKLPDTSCWVGSVSGIMESVWLSIDYE